jgi:hypothetical protein
MLNVAASNESNTERNATGIPLAAFIQSDQMPLSGVVSRRLWSN